MAKDEAGVLHRKYRPDNFDDFIGNDDVVASLTSIFERKAVDLPHAFLVSGPKGTGKTTLARIMKIELGCSDRDFYEYNSANLRGIDTIRSIVESINYSPMSSPFKIYFLDECHGQTPDAQRALLKILEDTPPHVIFILCTTEPEKLLDTIRDRCHRYTLGPLMRSQIMGLLKNVARKEMSSISEELLGRIAEVSEGIPRHALVLFDQVIDIEDEATATKLLIEGTTEDVKINDLCQSILSGNGWKKVSSLLSGVEGEPEQIRRAMLGYFEKVLRGLDGAKADKVAQVMMNFQDSFFNSGKGGLSLACYLATKVFVAGGDKL